MKIFTDFPENYELIDAGGGRKLERWGEVVTIRPEHQAYFSPALPKTAWMELADWEFIPQSETSLNGKWKKLKPHAPEIWGFQTAGFEFVLKITSNKHIGLFPEQYVNWKFIENTLQSDQRFLNAFAYTGAASVYGKKTGAEVLHCDSVKAMLDWGKINMEASGLQDIKWVLEDALKFIQREVKRGSKYDLIQMDPPAWGLGTKGEKWKLEELLPELLEQATQLLNPKGVLILNTYSPKVTIAKLNQITRYYNGFNIKNEELWMKTSSGKELYFGIVTKLIKTN